MTNFNRDFLLIITALLLLCISSSVSLKAQERGIKKTSWRSEPINIFAVKVNGMPIELNQNFTADDDWLRTLTISVKNTSDKAVVFISIDLLFPRLDDGSQQEPPALYDLRWGRKLLFENKDLPIDDAKILKPSETIEISLSEQEYASLKEFLRQTHYLGSITKLEIMLRDVGFEGDVDMTWSGGRMMRRDPNNPNRWVGVRP